MNVATFIDVALRQVLFYFDLEMQTVNKRKPSKTSEILAEHNRKKRAAVRVTTALRVKKGLYLEVYSAVFAVIEVTSNPPPPALPLEK